MSARRAASLAALLALFALASCGPRDVQQPAALVGHWQGHVAWRDATTPIELEVARSGDSLAATFSAPALGVVERPIGPLAYAPPRVHFTVRDSGGAFAFDGWLRRGLVVGAFSSPALGGETNPSRLPQLALKRRVAPARRAPWPESLSVAPPVPHERERSFGAWLLARAAR